PRLECRLCARHECPIDLGLRRPPVSVYLPDVRQAGRMALPHWRMAPPLGGFHASEADIPQIGPPAVPQRRAPCGYAAVHARRMGVRRPPRNAMFCALSGEVSLPAA